MSPLLLSLIVALGIQVVVFIAAYLLSTDKFTDLVYGLSFIIVSAVLFTVSGTSGLVKILIMCMVTLWGLRLAGYLFYRILKIKKDSRFDKIRNDPLKFLGFWILQGFTVFTVLLPASILLSKTKVQSFDFFSVGGLVLWSGGLIIETVADIQKFRFKAEPENKGKWVDSGFWKYSRHPNYFGEIMCWVGVFLFSVPYLSGLEFASIASPVYIALLIIFVSGVPTLEKRYDKRYKGNAEYQEYKNSTSLLVPWFRN